MKKSFKKANFLFLFTAMATISTSIDSLANNSDVVENVAVVQAGDTLWNIARARLPVANNATVRELIAYNDLSSANTLYIGQHIHIPVTEGEGLFATPYEMSNTDLSSTFNIPANVALVQAGDTLWSIARARLPIANNISVTELATYNELSNSSFLRIGQQIYIPDTEIISLLAYELNRAEMLNDPDNISENVAVVQPGDTLWSIARERLPVANNSTVSELARHNGFGISSVLSIGQHISIPTTMNTEIDSDSNVDMHVTTPVTSQVEFFSAWGFTTPVPLPILNGTVIHPNNSGGGGIERDNEGNILWSDFLFWFNSDEARNVSAVLPNQLRNAGFVPIDEDPFGAMSWIRDGYVVHFSTTAAYQLSINWHNDRH